MARRKPIPTVGTSGLNTAQLSPEERSILAHRAKAAARREYTPVLNADKQAFGTANKEYRSEAASARGGVNAVQSSLAQALAGLKGSGLSGKYLQQTKSEFANRAGDAAMSLPALLAGAGEERATKIGEARTQLIGDRATMQQSSAAKLNQDLKEARTAASGVLKEQQEDKGKASGPLGSDPRSLHNAFMTAQTGFKELVKNAGKWIDEEGKLVDPETEGAKEIHPPQTTAEWSAFAQQVASETENADETDAMNAVKLLQTRLNKIGAVKKVKRGLNPFG